MSATTVDGALLALVALWRSVTPTGVVVIDGPPYDPPENFLAVGWDRSDEAAVQSHLSVDSLVGNDGVESFDVSSLLSFSFDAGEVSTVRGRAFAAFAVFRSALSVDPTLDGSVMQAFLADYDMTPILTESGSVLDIRFTTSVKAWV